jgi:endonuclease/exonuclease/phosphatase (EEP) superfamily protein YafD
VEVTEAGGRTLPRFLSGAWNFYRYDESWRPLRLLVAAAAWLGAVPMAVAVLARLFWTDQTIHFIWINAFTFWVYLPAYGIALVAVALRRWALVAVSIGVVAFHLWWIVPDYLPASAVPAEAHAAPQLRLFTANVYHHNQDYSGIAAEAAEARPDLLFVQEYHDRAHRAFEAAGVFAELPFRTPDDRITTLMIFSRYPLTEIDISSAGGRPVIRATMEIGDQKIRLYNIHTSSPDGRWSVGEWHRSWDALIEELRGVEGTVMLAGDFNATQHHIWDGKLKDMGLHSAHEERGRGNATTWPNGFHPIPEIRIDHVFLSSNLVTLEIREGEGRGSDHRPVIADIAVLDR